MRTMPRTLLRRQRCCGGCRSATARAHLLVAGAAAAASTWIRMSPAAATAFRLQAAFQSAPNHRLPTRSFSTINSKTDACETQLLVETQAPLKSSASTQVSDLLSHPALWPSTSPLSKARRKLQPRHRSLFPHPTTNLFDEFAQVLCTTAKLPRKELFETWSAALYIYERFVQNNDGNGNENEMGMRRICDVAGGHGLLGWSLLLLDDAHRKTVSSKAADTWCSNSNGSDRNKIDDRPLTVLCVDRRMPPSAVAIQSAILSQWPHLASQFDYVEGNLEQLVPHPSCLLVSVHACGGLSDLLVSIAARTNSPITVVPCCHSRKPKALMGASNYAREEYDAIIREGPMLKGDELAIRLDEARMVALRRAGLEVVTVRLPERFTMKNRLIMAMPSKALVERTVSRHEYENIENHDVLALQSGQMPPLRQVHVGEGVVTAKEQFLSKFTIPCRDDSSSREVIRGLAGQVQAQRRKLALHRRGHSDLPNFDISFWLPPAVENTDWEEALSTLGSSIAPHVSCVATQLGDEFVHSTTGRRSRAFRLQYGRHFGDMSGDNSRAAEDLFDDINIGNDEAKEIHRMLYERIPSTFPGAECR